MNQNLLDDLNSIMLSRELAELFFPDGDPIGKELEGLVNDSVQIFVVNGVFEDLPDNSTFRAFEKKHISENPTKNYGLQKLTDVYLKSEDVANTGIQGNLKNIRLFSAVAFLIVLIAAFNYIILSIAVSTGRAKEIGIRKTAGASINIIRNQLLSESIMLALFVLPMALLMMWAAMPYAEKLFQTNLQIIRSNIAVYISVYLVLTIVIGIASGIYASSYLSKLKVLDVLKNTMHFGNKRKFFRSFLIVLQLVIFCSFVSSTMVIRSQYQFAIKKETGHYVRDVLLVNLGRNFNGYSAFLNNIKSNPNVIMAAGVMNGVPMMGSMTYLQPHFQDEEVKVKMEGLATDYHFLEAMGITLLEGRYFSEEYGSDLTHAVILNETAVERLGIEDPVGKQMGEKTIIGVVKDFNLHSIHSDIPPLDISLTDRYIQQLAVNYNPGTLDGVLKMLKAEWEKSAPDTPFDYSTIEELIENQYTSEKNLSTILSIAALFTLLIAAFGLFGLTLFVARSRTNEIGIKKVFGSSEQAIVYSFLQNKHWLVGVCIGFYHCNDCGAFHSSDSLTESFSYQSRGGVEV